MNKIQEIKDVLTYNDGNGYYVGGMATAHVCKVLEIHYDIHMNIPKALNEAHKKTIDEIHKYLIPYIKYMRGNSMKKCEHCGSLVRDKK